MAKSRDISKPVNVVVSDDVFSRALERIHSMTDAQRVQSLKDAGILTPSGKYSAPYRGVGRKTSRATSTGSLKVV
jgi:hypothetical protein